MFGSAMDKILFSPAEVEAAQASLLTLLASHPLLSIPYLLAQPPLDSR